MQRLKLDFMKKSEKKKKSIKQIFLCAKYIYIYEKGIFCVGVAFNALWEME